MHGSQIRQGMHVAIGNDDTVWIVLDRHPRAGHWWLHRWDSNGKWVTTYEHYKRLDQVLVKVC